jgi:repressor of nif and glnA expression
MVNISGDRLCVDDIPNQIKDAASAASSLLDELAERETTAILMALKHTKQEKGKGMGRRGLARIAHEYGFDLTENEIRAKMKKLEEIGLVNVNLGRGGTKISSKGELLLQEMGVKYFPDFYKEDL